jgi:signal recognition particle subunit SRP54
MFDSLAQRLQGTLSQLRSRGTLSEADVDAALREIRLALLEADVNFKVAREFSAHLKERCLGAGVIGGLNPGQQVIKIVADELTELMGGAGEELSLGSRRPAVILLAGLQGSGKTTAAAKLARHLQAERGADVALAACDVYRPAAVAQLCKVAAQVGAHVYEQGTEQDPVDIASWALAQAGREARDVLVIDTSGRLQVDEAMMAELARIGEAVAPEHVLLVIDAMTGQEAAGVAEAFAGTVAVSGVVMTKLDGDARGGAALSVKAVTGVPILFASSGESIEQFEPFHPDRMAQRILGMGDVMGLIERAERGVEQERAAELERKLRRNQFGLDDFLEQLSTIRRMGPLGSLLGMIPGLGAQLQQVDVDERQLDRLEAIIRSMTPDERRRPELIKGSRRLRIAHGSGTTVQEVSRLIKQFAQMRDMMRQVGRGRPPDIAALMRGAR